MDESIYREHGYEDREDYFRHLAERFDVRIEDVRNLADVLGRREDFDALVTSLEEFSGLDNELPFC